MFESTSLISSFRLCFDSCWDNTVKEFQLSNDNRSDINSSIRQNFMTRDGCEASYSRQTNHDNDSNIDDPNQGGQYNQKIVGDGECIESINPKSLTKKDRSSILSFLNRFKGHRYSRANKTACDSNDSSVTQLSSSTEAMSPLESPEEIVSESADLNQGKQSAKQNVKKYDKDVIVREHDSNSKAMKPILYEALTFHCNSKNEDFDIPSIPNNSFILPGSDLQRKMAQAVLSNTDKNIHSVDQSEDECVICMETFTYENPRMPTICGCGQNKTYFHLPCLYEWIEHDRNCPTCREKLRWEEY